MMTLTQYCEVNDIDDNYDGDDYDGFLGGNYALN